VTLFLPILNDITGKALHLDYKNPNLVIGVIGITLLCGVLGWHIPCILFVIAQYFVYFEK
jgi:hypothetical protein